MRSKKHYYQACQRNKFDMPSLTCALVTIRFCEKVRLGIYWCPKITDAPAGVLSVAPPPYAIVMEKVLRAIEVHRQDRTVSVANLRKIDSTMRKLGKYKADNGWLIRVLHCLNAKDEIFNKDYVYRRPRNFIGLNQLELIDNPDNFFDNLPELNVKELLANRKQLRLSKSQMQTL